MLRLPPRPLEFLRDCISDLNRLHIVDKLNLRVEDLELCVVSTNYSGSDKRDQM